MEELMKSLDGLEEVLNEEIRKVTKKADITPAELENMTKTLCLIEKIKMIKEGDSYWDASKSGHYNYPMWHGYSGEAPYPGPDGNWHSGRRHMRMSYGVSPDYGYSGHSIKDRMIAKLESMYDEAKTDHERQVVDEWIARLSDDKDRR